MDDRAIVAQLRDQDPAGLAAAYDAYGQRLYAFCRALLRDGSTAEDVVQDTLLIAYQRADQLRDPDRLRPWLYALARNECLRHIRARRRVAALEEAGEVAEEPTDPGFQLHQRDLSRLVWQAAEGLNPRERAALELSVRHGLAGSDLADAMGVTPNHAQTLLTRARRQLERGLAALLVSGSSAGCPELADIIEGWDGRLTVLMRKRISRHVERCGRCLARKREEVNATALLAAVPLGVPPLDLRTRLVRRAADPASEAVAPALDRGGFPVAAPGRHGGTGFSKATGGVAATAVLILLLGGVGALSRCAPGQRPVTVPGPVGSVAETSDLGTRQTSASGTPGVSPTVSRSTPHPRRSPGSPDRAAPQPTPTRVVTGDLVFGDDPLDLGVLSQKDVSVRAVNGPVTWTAKADPRLSVSLAGFTLATGQTTTVTVRLLDSGGEAGSANITFTLKDGSTQVLHVTWDKPIG